MQKLQSGVVVHFEKIGPDPPPLPGLDKDEDGETALSRYARFDTVKRGTPIRNCARRMSFRPGPKYHIFHST